MYADTLPPTADLIIIGGGVAGAATAFYAARAGLRPLLLEQRARLCTLTTPASTGAFRLQFDNFEELNLVRRSVELFLNFADITGQDTYDLDIRRQGYLFLTSSVEGMERQRRQVQALHAWEQTDVELLDDREVRSRFPYIGDVVRQARFRAGDGFLDPKQLTMGLAAASGAGIMTDCGVSGFRMEGNRVTAVETARGVVQTDAAIIAAGPFSGLLAAHAGVQLPVSTVLRQKVVMPFVPEVPSGAPMVIDEDTGSHWRPALVGAYVLFTDPSTPPSPPMQDVTPSHRFALRLLDPRSPVSVARATPFWRDIWERGAVNWIVQGGQYTMTPDHRPLIGATDVDGLFVNTGYSGHGIMSSPAGSQLLIDLLTGAVPAGENPFRLDRPFVPRELDIL